MHRLLLSMLLIAGFCGLVIVPCGKVWSTQTLFPSPTPSPVSILSGLSTPASFSTSSPTSVSTHYELAQHHGASQDLLPLQSADDDVDEIPQPDSLSKILPEHTFDNDNQSHDKSGNDSDFDISINQTEESTVGRRALGPKINGKFMGTVQIDFLQAPLVCQNAGWYQNCLNGARGNYKQILYENGPMESLRKDKKTPFADDNRYNSGVTTSFATPCNAAPFSQLFYDRLKGGHPLTATNIDKNTKKPKTVWVGLQTDEWPMASLWNPTFDPQASIPQVSLRCMDHVNNNVGGTFITTFRTCEGHYKPKGPYGLKDSKTGKRAMIKEDGKWAKYREAPIDPKTKFKECQFLEEGDTFYVNFNFDAFQSNNKAHNDLRATLKYADPVNNKWDCKNDGFQFHLQELRPTTERKSGKLANPYDTALHSLYRFGEETENIKQYFVELLVSDAPSEDVVAEVYQHFNRRKSLVKVPAKSVKVGKSFTLKGPLMAKTLTATRDVNCFFKFSYGTLTNGVSGFAFNTGDWGYGNFSRPGGAAKQVPGPAKYCTQTAVKDATKIVCSFPAW